MSNLIMSIAAQYPRITPARVSRDSAFGVILNNTIVGCTYLKDADSGPRITNQVLRELGYVDTKTVEGSLDDY